MGFSAREGNIPANGMQKGPCGPSFTFRNKTRPGLALPCLTEPCAAKTTLRAAGKAKALRAAVCNCHPTQPCLALPRRASPCFAVPQPLSKESSREPRKAPCCRLQLWPCHAIADHTVSRPTPPKPLSQKRAAEEAEASCAAVCNYHQTRPDRARACLA